MHDDVSIKVFILFGNNNEVLENSQQEGAVMEDNAKYYPEQPVSTQEKNTSILYGIVTNCKQLNVRRVL